MGHYGRWGLLRAGMVFTAIQRLATGYSFDVADKAFQKLAFDYLDRRVTHPPVAV